MDFSAGRFLEPAAEFSTAVLEVIGIAVLAVIVLYSSGRALWRLLRGRDRPALFKAYRRSLLRGILLALELLVAADIIRTVAIDLSFRSVGVLSIIIFIRTFISFTLELEMTGRWPWQRSSS